MAVIRQQCLFSWEDDVEPLGDLERLQLVITHLPDEELMRLLELERGNGRDDYPIRAMWNSILAGIVFQHNSVESLRRELNRNGQLRHMCGFRSDVPPAWVYSRFLRKLESKLEEVKAVFDNLADELYELLPDFGEDIVIDSKAIPSFASCEPKNKTRDGRRDTDAKYGAKTYKGKRADGTTWEKVTYWFGYKLHLIVDAIYELPIEFGLTVPVHDVVQGRKMVDELKKDRPHILERCETMSGDKAYDDTELIEELWDEHGIKPVIDIRQTWRDDDTRLVEGFENVVYNNEGTVFCHCMVTGVDHQMAFAGFEPDRETLKFRTPCHHYGIECKGAAVCPIKAKSIRIKIDEDRRIFTPMARCSYTWQDKYDRRTAVERVNSRLDVSFGFEEHTIRGLKKMTLYCSLALIVMLVMAVGRIKEGQMDKIRSLVA